MYQDPKGDHIDGTTTRNKTNDAVVNSTSTEDSYYKSKIVSLNEEIITLNRRVQTLDGELAMVCMY